MFRKINVFIIFCLYLIQLSCSNSSNDNDLNEILTLSTTNISELEKVLSHYSCTDSLKYKAAVFILKSMSGLYSKEFIEYPTFSAVFDSLNFYDTTNKNKLNKEIKILAKSFKLKKLWKNMENENSEIDLYDFTSQEDIRTIKAEYIIENIEYAFKAWQLPWAKHLSFDDFCKYILPYRYGTEELQPWRAVYFEEFKWVIDSAKGEKDPVKVCAIINNHLKAKYTFVYNSGLKSISNSISPLDLLKGKVLSTCADQNAIAMLAMRSMGIPVCHIVIPQWGDRSMGHSMSAVLDSKGKWIDFLGGEFNPGKNIVRNKVPKAYIEHFALQKRSLPFNVDSTFEIPAILRNKRYEDITSSIVPVTDVHINFNMEDESKIGYLCVFNNQDWIPVDYAKIKNNKAVFKDMGRGIVYLPATYSSGEIIPAGNPFLLDSLGKVKPFFSSSKKENVILDRKYPYNKRLIEMSAVTIGGRFQGANRKDFKDAADLYVIKKLPPQYPVKEKIKPTSYRYVRYIFPPSEILQGGITNIGFYKNEGNKTVRLNGEYLSSTEVKPGQYKVLFGDSTSYIDDLKFVPGMEKMSFDGYILVDKSKGNLWVGMDFLQKEKINAIGYMPRNDLNGIYEGQTYELFYWQNQWNSLGIKVANDKKIKFENVPKNSLLLLKNIYHGNEHRIFKYVNNKQIWF